jgi:hypothetical protein
LDKTQYNGGFVLRRHAENFRRFLSAGQVDDFGPGFEAGLNNLRSLCLNRNENTGRREGLNDGQQFALLGRPLKARGMVQG